VTAVSKPMYQQLKDLIIGRISSGELRPADRVPSENELVEAMSVSRMTANRALRELTDEGYVRRIAGRGTFVSDFRAGSHVLEVQNIADEIERRGHAHTCEVLRQSLQHARGEVAKALHVEQGSDVFHLMLVHYENGTPIQFEDRHVVANFAPDCLLQDFSAVTPSAYLTAISPLQEAEQVVRAAQPNAAVQRRLAAPGRMGGRSHSRAYIIQAVALNWLDITPLPGHPNRRRQTSWNWRNCNNERQTHNKGANGQQPAGKKLADRSTAAHAHE